MATAPTSRATNTTASLESALTPDVRRKLKGIVLELRHTLEDDFRRQLAAVAVTEEGVKSLSAGRALTPEQQRVRDVAVAVLKSEVAGGASDLVAFATLLRESVFTFLNRAIGLRCLEARGLLLVDGQTETAITEQEELGGMSSLYWRVRNAPGGPNQPREIWRETCRRACVAVSLDISVLFDPEAEYAALFPLMPAMQQVVAALNDPLIPSAAYAEDAVLGWVYQYFQSEEKDRIFAEMRTKKKKIGGADIIPVTQLYTEQYMVDFLLQNSLGRTWMEMYPDSPAKAAWPYYVEPATPHSRPRKPLRDWTVLDPCVGSGHFLVVAFDLLAQLYADERALAARGEIPAEWVTPEGEVAQTILEHNLYGIDIDRRATQLATLALYLKAREMGLPRPPRVNVVAADASFLAGPSWEKFLAGFEREPSVRRVLAAMAGYLKDIRELGSLLRPEEELKRLIAEEHRAWEAAGQPQQVGLFPDLELPRQESLVFEQITDETFWERLAYRAEAAIQGFYDSARASGDLDEQIVAGEAQRGFAFLELCQRRYDIVCTNPPYVGLRNMGKSLNQFVSAQYPAGKRDLFAAFMLRCQVLGYSDAYIAMVTPQSWVFLRRFVDIRAVQESKMGKTSNGFKGLLRDTCLETLAHLGAGAFAEIDGEVVKVVLVTFRNVPPNSHHHFTALRAVFNREPEQKVAQLRSGADRFDVLQRNLVRIPEAPICYWLDDRWLDLLATSSIRMHSVAFVREGLHTTDNARFVRCFWEVDSSSNRWTPYLKGGGYRRWAGLEWLCVDWEDDGRRIRSMESPVIPSYELYFREGYTYTEFASGTIGVRYFPSGRIFDAKGPVIIARDGNSDGIAAIANSRPVTFMLRALSPSLQFLTGYVNSVPIPEGYPSLAPSAQRCVDAATFEQQCYPTESCFRREITPWTWVSGGDSRVVSSSQVNSANCLRLVTEGLIEQSTCTLYQLTPKEISTLVEQLGTPAGWHPLINGYHALPELPSSLSPVLQELTDYLAHHERIALAPERLTRLKDRLRAFYVAGPGAKVEGTAEADGKNGNHNAEDKDGDEEEDASIALGARIPIPAETFLEELSQLLEVHPISVYWLLEEMRREEGLVCPPEMKRQIEDYASVTLLRELGFRWPGQDNYEAEHGPILDPTLVVTDGILPLVECGAGANPTAAQQIRRRLECEFGEEGAEESEAEFRKWVDRPLEEWLRRDFFKRHISQFKQRPIAWHLRSKEGGFEAFVLYHKLCDEVTARTTLGRLRTVYAGGRIEQLRAEQERAKTLRDFEAVSRLQISIEDIEEFRQKLERIERGDDLKARIRCRWKGDEAKIGRPGPYAPDINDGVKVNVRPFQELGLLAAPVIKKWE